MPPDDVADYVCFDSFFEYVDRSIYSAEDIPFFHLSDEDFLMIRKDGKIVYFGEVIADSFIDFMRKELEVPDFFIK
jgi:NAD-dependent SIR2 family protein deacetylase